MFNNVVLDVFIGLIFIFLLYSLLATIIQEIIARLFNLRAKLLVKALEVMLEDRDEESDEDKHSMLRTVSRFFKGLNISILRFFNASKKESFTKVFYKHPAIKYLGQSSWQSKPAYLEPSNFSSTLTQLLRGKEYDGSEPEMNAIYRTLFDPGLNSVSVETAKKTFAAGIDPETLQHIQQLYINAQKDTDRFKALLENWFNETMNRASGWYRRQTQSILFFIGLFIAISFNVDTIAVYRLLAKDKTAREQMVQLAISSRPRYDTINAQLTPLIKKDSTVERIDQVIIKNQAGKDSVTTNDTVWTHTETKVINLTDSALAGTLNVVQSDIDKAKSIVSLGWPDKGSCKRCRELKKCLESKCITDSAGIAVMKDSINYYNKTFQCSGNPYQQGGGIRWLGWIITALAISLGAPFWFDIMNKALKLRGTGTMAKTSGDAAKTDGSASAASSPVQRKG
jgi:hypothetical protein